MGLDIEKTQEELNKKIAQTIDTPLSEEHEPPESGLSAIESQNLNTGLSGEVITSGFSEQEAEALTDGLSGDTQAPMDSVAFSKPNEPYEIESKPENDIETDLVQQKTEENSDFDPTEALQANEAERPADTGAIDIAS